MRLLLLLNGSRARYAGGAGEVSTRLGLPVLDPAYLALRTTEMLVGVGRPMAITA